MADILIIDFGSQYTHLIVTTLQYKIGVNSNLFPYTEITTEHIQKLNPKGIILSGGPQSVFDFPVQSLGWLKYIIDSKIPVRAPRRLLRRC
jgi:GMP synthase-like glutamine amidotransferase